MSKAIDQIHQDLCHVMQTKIERVLKHYGIEHWLPSILLVNPENRAGEWILVSNDEPGKIAETVLQRPADVREAKPWTEPEDVHCPRCGAEPRASCVSLRGGSVMTPTKRPHRERSKRAARMNRGRS